MPTHAHSLWREKSQVTFAKDAVSSRAMFRYARTFLNASSLALMLALVCSVSAAKADGKAASLAWVRLPGAERCASSTDIANAVAERLGRDPWVSLRASELFIDAVVYPRPGGYRVTIQNRESAGGAAGTREIDSDGVDCRGLDEPAVLAITLMVDPDAVLRAPTPIVRDAPVAAVVPVAREAALPEPPRVPPTFSFSAGGLAARGFHAALTPGATFRLAWHAKPQLFAELGLAMLASSSGNVDGPRGALFNTYFASPSACVFEFGGDAIRIRPCAGLDIGLLDSQGIGFLSSRRNEGLLLNADVEVRARFFFTRKLGIEIGAKLGVPLVRHDFYGVREDMSVVSLYQTPHFVGLFEIALFGVDGP